jgi:hypothetical protein
MNRFPSPVLNLIEVRVCGVLCLSLARSVLMRYLNTSIFLELTYSMIHRSEQLREEGA